MDGRDRPTDPNRPRGPDGPFPAPSPGRRDHDPPWCLGAGRRLDPAARRLFEHGFADAAGLLSIMVVVLVIGIVVDALGCATLERHLRRRRGLETP